MQFSGIYQFTKFSVLLLLAAFIVQATNAGDDNTFNQPDSTVILTFDNLPPTLFSQAVESNKPTQAAVYFPENYTKAKNFPLLIWLGGGNGGPGTNLKTPKSITGNNDFICINLPLFKEILAPVNADSSNFWMRLYIDDENADIIWDSYKLMLKEIFRNIPNIDRKNTFMGGFSNGAHTISVLLNRKKPEINRYIKNYFIVEGGNDFHHLDALKRRNLLVMVGGNNIERGYKKKLKNIYDSATEKNIDAEYHIMDSTGHGFPAKFHPLVKRWIVSCLKPVQSFQD